MCDRSVVNFYKENNAEYLNFKGKSVPAWFSNVNSEYITAKEHAGVIHRDDVRVIFISGEDRSRIVDKITTTDLSKAEFFTLEHTVVCETDGSVVDLVKLYLFDNGILMICSCNLTEDVLKLMEREKGDLNVEFHDISKRSSIYTIVGPDSVEILSEAVGENIHSLNSKQFHVGSFEENEIIVSRSDTYGNYTFDILVEPETDEAVLNFIKKIDSENKARILPIGFLAFNILRIENMIPTISNEMSVANLFEVGLESLIREEKDPFIGKDALDELRKKGIERSMFLATLENDANVKINQPLYDENNNQIGIATSSAYSPELEKTLIMGFVNNSMNVVNGYIYLNTKGERELSRAQISRNTL